MGIDKEPEELVNLRRLVGEIKDILADDGIDEFDKFDLIKKKMEGV